MNRKKLLTALLNKIFPIKKIVIFFLFLIVFFNLKIVLAGEGSIDNNYKYAWGENIGWVNFNPTGGNVKIFDDKLTGYIWSENYGWINLCPTKGCVFNNGGGGLSGYAWGENLGWIDFSNVRINPSTGEFSGYALILIDNSKINFDCHNCKVKTNWRPTIQSGAPPAPTLYFSGSPTPEYYTQPSSSTDFLLILNLLRNLFMKKPTYEVPSRISPIDEVPSRISPIESVTPKEKEKPKEEKPEKEVILAEKKLKEEFVFIKSKYKKIELTPYLKISENLKPEVSYEFLIGEYIEILFKPNYIVDKIEGELYFVDNLYKKSNIFEKLKSLIISISTRNQLSYNQKFTFQKEDKFYKALVKLPENPGIYHLNINIYYTDDRYANDRYAPKNLLASLYLKNKGRVRGDFLITKFNLKGAFVYLYKYNSENKKFELWNSEEFLQSNPQITDDKGEYAFIVPAGYYYLLVKKNGFLFLPFVSNVFFIFTGEGKIINYDINLVSPIILVLIILIIILLFWLAFRKLFKKYLNSEFFF